MEILFGYLGVFLLATSGIPQVFRTLRTKNVNGLSPYSMTWVCLGCCSMLTYLSQTRGISIISISYIVNACVSLTNLTLYFIYKK